VCQGNRILSSDDFEQIALVPTRLEALILDPHLRCLLLFEAWGVQRLHARTNAGFMLKVWASLFALLCMNAC